MNRFLKIVIMLALCVSFLQAFAFEKLLTSQSAHITMQSVKQLVPGSNMILLRVAEAKYYDADVKIKFFMPAAPDMPYMEIISHANNVGNGLFNTKVNLSMGGTWQVHIFLLPKKGKKIQLKTSINI